MTKTITQENGTLTIIGNNHWIPIEYEMPVYEEEYGPQACFRYKGDIIFLSEFVITPDYLAEYDGIMNYSYFSGLLVKMGEDDNGETAVKVYRFYS